MIDVKKLKVTGKIQKKKLVQSLVFPNQNYVTLPAYIAWKGGADDEGLL